MSQKHDPKILKRVVEAKLENSGALSNAKRGGFGSNPLGLASDNSIILDFQGLKPDSQYRMLLCFLEINLHAPNVLRNIGRCRDIFQIDLAVFCTFNDLTPDQIYAFKTSGAHVLCLDEIGYVGAPYQTIPDFIHVPEISYKDLLDINFLANEIANRLRKKFHLVLSELAAETYSDYGTFATREVMNFEDELLRETLNHFLADGRGTLAIDVGCGDGRHSRVLANNFNEVIAFDISHKMIEAARSKDRRELCNTTPVTYYECDVEYEEFPDEEKINGRADFVCASFGMPSFVEDTAGFVRRVYKWLRPGGQVLFTFYNSKSIGLGVETPWKERSLSALIDISRRALEVELRDDIRFSIYCRTFDEKVRSIVTTGFSLLTEHSFPHMLTLLPPSIFGSDEQPQGVARDIFPKIDREISSNKYFSRGHYIFLVLEKKAEMCTEGFMRVISELKEARVEYKILEHAEIVSMSDVEKLLEIPKEQMVKTVIFKRRDNKQFFVAIVPANSRVDISLLAKLTECKKRLIDLADAKAIESRFGFPIGGISPFGFDKAVSVFVDNKICKTEEPYMYMGIGDNKKTLKLSTSVFHRLIKNYLCTDIIIPAKK